MSELIIFPDVEGLLVAYLNAALAERDAGASASTRVPNPRPSRFVRCQRVGGPVSSLFVVDTPLVVVEAWGRDDVDAQQLLSLTRALLHVLPDVDARVYRVDELSGPGNLPDPLSDQSRYTMTLSLSLRGDAA